MKLNTRRKLRKRRVKKRFVSGTLKLSATFEGMFGGYCNCEIKRVGTKIRKDMFSIHELTVLENIGVTIEELCGNKYKRELFVWKKKLKEKLVSYEK